MSILKGPPREETVAALLLGLLSKEDANVVAAEEELTKCLAVFERQKQQVLALREALSVLGQDPDRLEGLGEL